MRLSNSYSQFPCISLLLLVLALITTSEYAFADYNITISNTTNVNGTWTGTSPNFVWTPSGPGANVSTTDIATNLSYGGSVIINTAGGGGAEYGDIYLNSPVSWSTSAVMTFAAARNITINSAITATGTAQLSLQYGLGAPAAGNTATYSINAPVNLSAVNSFSTMLGSGGTAVIYTVITSLGAEGSITGTDLQGMAGNLSGNYALGVDIDASVTSTPWNSGQGFTPVGNTGTNFSGRFEGLGHTINGLYINLATADVGLFGATSAEAVIQNVGLTSVNVTGGVVGAVAGSNSGSIRNVYSTGTITAVDYGSTNSIGGLAGGNNVGGSIVSSYSDATVTANATWRFGLGGLAGYNDGTITNSHTTGNVTGSYSYSGYGNGIGGLVGWGGGDISNSYSTGTVSSIKNFNQDFVGGLIGGNSGIVSNSYSTSPVIADANDIAWTTAGSAAYAGGLVGSNSNSIINSYASGPISLTISDSLSLGWAGGLVGGHWEGSTIINSYSTGSITVTDSFARSQSGGLVGGGSLNNIFNSFWDTLSSGRPASFGGTGKTTLEMKSQATYPQSAGQWDFSNIWGISGGTYPSLKVALSSTPIVISGTAAETSGTVDVIAHGALLGTAAITGGSFSLTLPAGIVTNGEPVLLAESGSAGTLLPVTSNTLNYNLLPNTLLIHAALRLSDLVTIKGTLINASIPYTASGANVTLQPGSSLLSYAPLGINGTIQSTGITTNSKLFLTGDSTLDSLSGNLALGGVVTGYNTVLTLSSSGTVNQDAPIYITGATSALQLLGGGGAYTLANAANNVTVLAGNTGSVSFTNSAANWSIGTVYSTVGLTATGTVTFTTAGAVTQTAPIVTTALNQLGGGSYTLPSVIIPLLTITKAGTGSGSVTANSGTIAWTGATGSVVYSPGTSVTLTATPSAGSAFTGWYGGGCSGTGDCAVTMDGAKYVTAGFRLITSSITAQVTGIAAGNYHSVALKGDGTVWGWGLNDSGQLGNGTTTNSPIPVQANGLSDVIAIDTGSNHTIALKNDGTVWTWGLNASGQLGDGTTTNSSSPIQISGLTGIIGIASGPGASHNIALKNDGTVWTWGLNDHHQLGNETTTNSLAPVQVSGLSGVMAIASGNLHTIALKNDGTVWAWGYNNYGQLGDGTVAEKYSPVQVSGLTGVSGIAAGAYFSLALKEDGTVWSWGFNGNGQLGDGTTVARKTPVQVSGLSGVTAISAGNAHSVALKSDGTVWAWGYNGDGRLGDGTFTSRYIPVQVSGVTDVAAIAAGYCHTMVIKNDGTVWSWGLNDAGQLGDGISNYRTTPLQLVGLTGVTNIISAGDSHTLAIKVDGTFWAWGLNSNGQLGDGTYTSRATPIQPSALLSGATAVAAGASHNVALKTDGTVLTWGNNATGQLGDGTTTTRPAPVPVSGLIDVTAISANGPHTLTLKSDGTIWAWGYNYNGQLGNGSTATSLVPLQVSQASGLTGVAAISAGNAHSVALKSDGTVWGWGYNWFGSLGDTTNASKTTPVQANGLTGVTAIATGDYHTVALKNNNTLWAWGNNQYGQLGDGSTINRWAPVSVNISGLTGVITAIAASGYQTLALTDDGKVWAWGNNQYGQLGDGTITNRSTPVQVSGLSGITAIAAGLYHSVAIKNNGTVWMWGSNSNGQLGNGSDPLIKRQALLNLEASTGSATNITSGGATLNGTVNDGGIAATVSFEYGQTTSYGSSVSAGTVTAGMGSTPVSATISGLACGTTYHFRASAQYSGGTVLGGDATFIACANLLSIDKSGAGAGSITSAPAGISCGATCSSNFTSGTVVTITASAAAGSVFTGWYGGGCSGAGDCQVSMNEAKNVTAGFRNLTPPQTARATSIAAGFDYSVALKGDGTVWTFGTNNYGELGNGTLISSPTPAQAGGVSYVAAIGTGTSHTIALKNDGTVWTWGLNTSGQLGNGTTANSPVPVQVSGLTGVIAVSSGSGYHSVALKNDGTVWAWGYNGYGQLGDGSTVQKNTPVQVIGLSGVIAITSGAYHTLALKNDGTVWTWGYNNYGQIGDGTATFRHTPVQVSGIANVTAIAAGAYHSLALKEDGTVWGWGYNNLGQLGNGTTANRPIPVQVSGLTGITAIAANIYQSMALKGDGTIWGCGNNSNGQLGDGTSSFRQTPVQASGVTGATAIAAGYYHSLALKDDDTIWGWGSNAAGQLGDGITIHRSTPLQVSGLTGITAIAAGGGHTMAIKSGGVLWTWGLNSYGQLGNGATTSSSTPIQPDGLSGVTTVAVGWYHSLAIKNDGTVWAWGNNANGVLGDGTTTNRTSQVQVSALTGVIMAISAGYNHSVALKDDGAVWTWGANSSGQLGDGTVTVRNLPVLVSQASGLTGATAIAAGYSHTVALKSDGTVWAWGNNSYGQLGDSTVVNKSTPVQISGLSGITAIAAGDYHTVARKNDGTIWVWGRNQYGQLADGTTTNRPAPVQVNGLTDVTAITAGSGHTMALKSDGTVWAWGYNARGQLGDGTTTDSWTPIQVNGLTGIMAISAGSSYSVALKNDGTVRTWGYNSIGQLGDGSELYLKRQIPLHLDFITWTIPSAITHGTALNATQLNATASVAGTFVYTPANGTVLNAGTQTLSVTFLPTDLTYYMPATKTVNLVVNRATPVITWDDPAAITYGTALSATELNATASVPGTLVYSPASGILSAGLQSLSVAFAPTDSTNYTTATKNVSLVVNQATPVITWATPSAITYGTALGSAQLNATASVAGTFVYTPVSGILTAGTQSLSVAFSPTDTANYDVTTATVSLTVAKAPLTVKAQNMSRSYGTANPTDLAFTVSGLVGDDTIGSVTSTIEATATSTAIVGSTHTITPSAALFTVGSATNYSISYSPGTLTIVGQMPQEITGFAPPSNATYGDGSITLSATASSTLPVTFSVVSGPGTITNNNLTITGAGIINLKASQGGDANHAPAIDVTGAVVVAAKALTVTAQNASRVEGVVNPAFSAAFSGFVNGDTQSVVSGAPSFSTTATIASQAGSYPITINQGTLSAANYTFTFVNGALTVTAAPSSPPPPLTITPVTPPMGIYGNAYSLPLTATGGQAGGYTWTLANGSLPPGLTLSGGVISGIPSQAGSYTFTVQAADTAPSPASDKITLAITIDKAPLTVTAVSVSRSTSSSNPVFSATYTGFVNNDTITVLSGAPVISTTAVASSPVGSYDLIIVQGTLTSANYAFTFISGKLTISDMATDANGATLAQISVAAAPGSHVTIPSGTQLKDANGNPVTGPLTMSSSAIGAISALPPEASVGHTSTATGASLSLVALGASINLNLSAGNATVKIISPPMTVNLAIPSTFAVPGATIQYYSFDGTTWQLEGSAQVKTDGTVDMLVGHLSVWAVAKFQKLPSGKIVLNSATTDPVTVGDALRALQIAVGMTVPTANDLAEGDVAPLVNGRPSPNNTINVGDAIVILQKALGIVNW